MRLEQVRQIAVSKGWAARFFDPINKVIGFKKDDVEIHIHYDTNIVLTTLTHPLWGRNKLYRRGINYFTLGRLFDNPRLHTLNGFRKTPLTCKCGSKRCFCAVGDPHFFCDHQVWHHSVPPEKKKARLGYQATWRKKLGIVDKLD